MSTDTDTRADAATRTFDERPPSPIVRVALLGDTMLGRRVGDRLRADPAAELGAGHAFYEANGPPVGSRKILQLAVDRDPIVRIENLIVQFPLAQHTAL